MRTIDSTTHDEQNERLEYYIQRIRELYDEYKVSDNALAKFVAHHELSIPDNPDSPFNAYILNEA
jgi:hypothetical protein